MIDLAGWQLDKLAANPQKQAEDESDDDSDDGIPFACLIGRHPFTDPIVTRCGHYFAHLAQSSGMQRRRSVRPAERLRMGSSIAQIKS